MKALVNNLRMIRHDHNEPRTSRNGCYVRPLRLSEAPKPVGMIHWNPGLSFQCTVAADRQRSLGGVVAAVTTGDHGSGLGKSRATEILTVCQQPYRRLCRAFIVPYCHKVAPDSMFSLCLNPCVLIS